MKRSPNVLTIMCDQLNASVLNCYGGRLKTKNIDRLAKKGMAFDCAYCQTPLCTPSRASFITGLYPHNHGISSNVMRIDYPVVGGPETEEGINNEDITTDKILHDAGYTTAHYGKWHLSGEYPYYYNDMYREHHEYEVEMKELFDDVQKKDKDDYMDWYGWKLPVTVSDNVKRAKNSLSDKWGNRDFYTKLGRLDIEVENTFDYKVASKSIDFINNIGENPFSLTCSFNLPHDPNVIPDPYYSMVHPSEIEIDRQSFTDRYFQDELSLGVALEMGDDFMREFIRIYYASVLFIDDQVGRVLDALENNKMLDDTIIVFVADHGDMAGGHGMFWKSTKAFYDEIARVPLIISYPNMLKAGIYDNPVELTDVMPTLLELTNQKALNLIDGESLVPYISGLKDGVNRVAFSERIKWNKMHVRNYQEDEKDGLMVRTKRWKYSIYPDGKEFLFDMENDKDENKNIANDSNYNHIKDEMKCLIESKLPKTNY